MNAKESKIVIYSLVAAAFVILCVIGYAAVLIYTNRPLADWRITHTGVFGDSFGVFASLFSGLAFVGLIAATLLQREQLQLQREELALQREEQELARKTSELQTKFLALATMYQIFELRLKVRETSDSGRLFNLAAEIEKQVEHLLKKEA
jgi:hypothetical protein